MNPELWFPFLDSIFPAAPFFVNILMQDFGLEHLLKVLLESSTENIRRAGFYLIERIPYCEQSVTFALYYNELRLRPQESAIAHLARMTSGSLQFHESKMERQTKDIISYCLSANQLSKTLKKNLMQIFISYTVSRYPILQNAPLFGVCTRVALTAVSGVTQIMMLCLNCSKGTKPITVCTTCQTRCHAGHALVFSGFSTKNCNCSHYSACKVTKPVNQPLVILDKLEYSEVRVDGYYKDNIFRWPMQNRWRVVQNKKKPWDPIQNVYIQDRGFMFSCKHTNPNEIQWYFELIVHSLPKEWNPYIAAASVGVSTCKTSRRESLLGTQSGEIGLFSENGALYYGSSEKMIFTAPWTVTDVIGCGITNEGKVFFTRNG